MQNFAAIDFETANMYRTSVCSVGLVIVRDGITADKFYSLIRPTPHFYTSFNTKIHGICKEDTLNAPLFPGCLDASSPLCRGSDAGCS